jgi:hypothetical protein
MRMQSNTRLEFIIEAVPALIGYVDTEERYRFNNHACEQWFGRPVLAYRDGKTRRKSVSSSAGTPTSWPASRGR